MLKVHWEKLRQSVTIVEVRTSSCLDSSQRRVTLLLSCCAGASFTTFSQLGSNFL